ncbi:MAG: hypothetical protein RLZZ28_1330 [Bacteroidota bacterium]|jgi:3-deoxy-D-manno-octulosonic-acid transferase
MIFYRLFIWIYPKLVWLISFSNPKAGLWISGRRDVFKKLAKAFHQNTRPVIWIHTASVGEFEQGRPVLESIKKQFPAYKVLLTFFSPSGYELRKDYRGADEIFYLPMDSPDNARSFYTIVQPSLVIFVKYEYWFYYLREAKKREIPLLLVSGIFRRNQPFFQWYGGMHKKMLSFFSYLFVQNRESAALLEKLGLQQVAITGDTRFDRVIEIAENFQPIDLIENFCNKQFCIVAGSTWTEDDEELDHFANTHSEIRFIIAPHEIEKERIDECRQLYKNALLFSELRSYVNGGIPIPSNMHVLIIDNVGMLSSLYAYANISYVGGGFGDDGIHNILEPAVFGKPVIIGPVYDKYFEASELIEMGGAFSIETALELESLLNDLMTDSSRLDAASESSKAYVRSKAGATAAILQYIQENRLLTN